MTKLHSEQDAIKQAIEAGYDSKHLRFEKEATERNVRICKKLFLDWLKVEIKKDWGKRCKEYERGCPCCLAWKYYDKIKS